MSYDEDTLRWLIDRSNVNIFGFYKNNLKNLPSNAKYELLRAGIIIKSYQTNRVKLTEKGRILLEELEE